MQAMLQVHIVQSKKNARPLSYEGDNPAEHLESEEKLTKKTIKGQRYHRLQLPNFTSKKNETSKGDDLLTSCC